MFGRVRSLRLRLSTRLCISSRSNTNIQQGTTWYLIVYLMAQCAVHALKGLTCRALATPASSPASHCKQCSALASLLLHARGCTSLYVQVVCAVWSSNHNVYVMDPNRRYPTVPPVAHVFTLRLSVLCMRSKPEVTLTIAYFFNGSKT